MSESTPTADLADPTYNEHTHSENEDFDQETEDQTECELSTFVVKLMMQHAAEQGWDNVLRDLQETSFVSLFLVSLFLCFFVSISFFSFLFLFLFFFLFSFFFFEFEISNLNMRIIN